jgi:hypothetical protein
MANIARIPYNAAIGATIDISSVTSVNESAGGISGRTTIRQAPIRQFHLTIGPYETYEVASIWITHRRMWPVGVRNWYDYEYTDQLQEFSSFDSNYVYFPLRRLIEPSTGTRFWHQRILIPDEEELPTTISVNGTPLLRSDWAFTDFGIAAIPHMHVPSGAVVTASGQELVAACFLQDMITVTVYAQNDDQGVPQPITGINDVQLREILEPELIALMAEPDDSI